MSDRDDELTAEEEELLMQLIEQLKNLGERVDKLEEQQGGRTL